MLVSAEKPLGPDHLYLLPPLVAVRVIVPPTQTVFAETDTVPNDALSIVKLTPAEVLLQPSRAEVIETV